MRTRIENIFYFYFTPPCLLLFVEAAQEWKWEEEKSSILIAQEAKQLSRYMSDEKFHPLRERRIQGSNIYGNFFSFFTALWRKKFHWAPPTHSLRRASERILKMFNYGIVTYSSHPRVRIKPAEYGGVTKNSRAFTTTTHIMAFKKQLFLFSTISPAKWHRRRVKRAKRLKKNDFFSVAVFVPL